MTSTARLGLVGLSAFLLLFPLALGRPGAPTHLKADEAAYYGMALSLGHDGDLRFSPADVDRFFVDFPYQPVNNLILMSADGWRTVSYAKPFVYSLFAAPFVRAGGAHGMLVFNTLLLVAMIWMGALYLRRYNDAGIAALFASGFFVLSVGFVYVYWLQPEVFNMAAICAALWLGLPREGEEEGLPRPRREAVLAALSGAALALAVYNKPMLAVIAAAPLWSHWRERRWRRLASWLAGAGGCLLLLAGVAFALTGTPTPYLAAKLERGGFTLCGPGEMPVFPNAALPPATGAEPGGAPLATASPPSTAAPTDATAAANPVTSAASATGESPPTVTPSSASGAPAPAGTSSTAAPASGAATAIAESPTRNTYSWLFRLPDTSPSEFALNVVYFLVGRHAGLLPYMPFAVLAVALFLVHGRRSAPRWVLLGASAVIALFFLLQIAWNWQGGGGFVGNRYFVNVYPVFLFLVTRIRPRWLLLAGFGLAGIFLSPLVLAPQGTPGPEPTLQMHVRGAPYRWLPLELTLRNVPGYHRVPMGGVRFIGRREAFLPLTERMWVFGGLPVELHLVADRPLGPLAFEVGSLAPHNRVEMTLGSAHESFELGAGESRRVVLAPRRPSARWTIKTGTLYAYRLTVETSSGLPRTWQRELPPPSCPDWPWQPKEPDSFFVGAELLYLGTPEGLDADVYAVQWRDVAAPPQVHAGERFEVPAVVVNTSRAEWRREGGARVRLAYHWLDGDGREILRDGERTELPAALPPAGEAKVTLRVVAPAEPGRYLLELDPVFETVAWFSERNGGRTLRVPVEVTAAAPAAATASPASAAAPAPPPEPR